MLSSFDAVILFTCAGKRNYLLQYFRNCGLRVKIIAADSEEDAPALQDADKSFLVPRIDHPDYFPVLEKICTDESVDLIISLNDYELPLLAKQRDRFKALGTKVYVGDFDFVMLCLDKYRCTQFLGSHGFAVPETYIDIDAACDRFVPKDYPIFLKPRIGSASAGLVKLESHRFLRSSFELLQYQSSRGHWPALFGLDDSELVMIQKGVNGQEYGMDVVNDFNGNFAGALVRKKLEMRAGETFKAETVHDEDLRTLAEKLSITTRHFGSIDCDVIRSQGELVLIDLNPRFGGGYPFSHLAGANLPRLILEELINGTVDNGLLQYEAGVAGSKYLALAKIMNNVHNCLVAQ